MKQVKRSLRLQDLNSWKSFLQAILLYHKQVPTLWSIKQRRYSRFTSGKNTISNLPKISWVKFLRSYRVLCFTRISKVDSFKNFLQWLLACLNFCLVVRTKDMISVNYGSRTSSCKPWRWMRLNLLLKMRDVCINSNLEPFTSFISSSRSTEFKDILSWKISQMIMKIIQISTRIFISLAMKRDITFEFERKSVGSETSTWSEFANGKKVKWYCQRNKSKRTELWESQLGIWVWKLTIWVSLFETEKS